MFSSTTETFAASGSTLKIATTCPSGATERTAKYSVLAGVNGKKTIVIYHDDGEGGVTGNFFEKQ
ncbi:MAG TPA: hypothetical protein VM925_01340 [Labilithrix sp.]|jgi:hypothetical protein|nr:hypothetical protein [Labilithrix sp.]